MAKEFKPTYLCIKHHSITGLLYFCKTTCDFNKMIRYKGSGTYWKNHLRKHGKEYVETLWYRLFTEKEDIVEFALRCSEEWDIINSKDPETQKKIWANEKFENGIDGGSVRGTPRCKLSKPSSRKGTKQGPSPKRGKKYGPHKNKCKHKKIISEEHRKSLSLALKGKKQTPESNIKRSNANKGKKQSAESNYKNSIAKKGKTWEEIYGVEGAKLRRDAFRQRKELAK